MLEQLYQEVIQDHYRNPQNNTDTLDGESVKVHHSNPTCGDEMDLRIAVDGDTLSGIAFSGDGCSISQASASAMTVAVKGRDLDDALDLIENFRAMMGGATPERADDLGDGIVFEGVAKFPVRVKCALLGWMAAKDAILTHREGGSVSTQTIDTTADEAASASRSL